MIRTFPVISLILAAALALAVDVPKVWDDAALATMELPLAVPGASPKHVSSEYYYRMPVRPIYKSYPIYVPKKEPKGYFEFLQQQEPEVAFDSSKLKTGEDWVKAGELVFDAPVGFGATFKLSQVRDPAWYEHLGIPVAKDGTIPFARYVIRRKGEVEVGTGSCGMCHTRVLPDGRAIKGAQGNLPVDRAIALNLRAQAAENRNPQRFLEDIRGGQKLFFGLPWLRPDPLQRIDSMSLEDIAAAYDAIPPGVTTRVNLSLFIPAQIPNLIGVCDLKHLDHTGIVRQRSREDLMRYVALVQGGNSFDRFGDFALFDRLPDPKNLQRYSDEQLYALAEFVCSLRPPKNPVPVRAAAVRGKALFQREGCTKCHTPPLYTNNDVIPVEDIGTDPGLALQTRKGTGYYKVPSLRGVWYRGPLEHNGSVLALEDWFNPRRRDPDYVPTGFRGLGINTRAVKGHPFGLSLLDKERKDLIAFLRTL